MDPNYTSAQLQEIITNLSTATDSQFAKEAQAYLFDLQKQPAAWEIANDLLRSSQPDCQFFGAHTLQVKISRDWETFPQDRIQQLRQELISWILQFSAGPPFILTKLCTALTAYAIRTVPDQWPKFIIDFCETLESSARAQERPVESVMGAMLEFLTVVVEEFGRADLIGERKLKLTQSIKDSTTLVFHTLQNLLSSPLQNPPILHRKALKCFQSWIQYGISILETYPIIELTIQLISLPDLFEPATDVLMEIMTSPGVSSLQRLESDLWIGLTSDWLVAVWQSCIVDEDDFMARTLSRLLTTFGETYTDTISRVFQQPTPQLQRYLEIMLSLTNFPGYFGADQSVSDIPLNFWYLLQEAFYDEGILDEGNTNFKEARELAFGVFGQLIEILRTKCELPPDHIWLKWSRDTKDQFRNYRREVGDTLVNSYHVLRERMLAKLTELAIVQLNQESILGGDASGWQNLEATLFCVKCAAEAVSKSENIWLPRFFGPEVFGKLPQEGYHRLRNMALLVIGAYAEWLKVHPSTLLPLMNLLVAALSDSELSPPAATAFKEVCEICREALKDYIGDLVKMYSVVGRNVAPREKVKVLESIASVAQTLDNEHILVPLMALTGEPIQVIKDQLILYKQDPNGTRQLIINQIRYLTAVARGIQPPDDPESVSSQGEGASSLQQQKAATRPPHVDVIWQQFTATFSEAVEGIAIVCSTDEEMMIKLCQLLETSVSTDSNLPALSLSFLQYVLLIQSAYQRQPFSCWLDTAAKVVVNFGGDDWNISGIRDLVGALTLRTLEGINNTQGMEQYPDIVASYFNLISRVLKKSPNAFYGLPIEMLNNILVLAVAGLGLQEPLVLKPILSFVAEFVAQDTESDKELGTLVKSAVEALGMQIMQEVLLGLGGRLPRSLITNLYDILYRLTGNYVVFSRQWLNVLLSKENFPSPHVDLATKETFAKNIMGTRSPKRFKEILQEFSLKCRKLDNTAFGAAVDSVAVLVG